MKNNLFAAALSVLAMLALPGVSQADGLSTQDYIEIEQLYAAYNIAIDTNEPEAWANTFTADGVFMNYTGHDALAGFVKAWHERMGGGTRRHWNSNLRITGDAAKAQGMVYLMLIDTAGKTIFSTGMYKDDLVKTPQGWRFAKRNIVRDAAPAAPAQQQPK